MTNTNCPICPYKKKYKVQLSCFEHSVCNLPPTYIQSLNGVFLIFAESLPSIMHNRKTIIGCPKSFRTFSYFKVVTFSKFDILLDDFHIVITICTGLLMIESNGVDEFVHWVISSCKLFEMLLKSWCWRQHFSNFADDIYKRDLVSFKIQKLKNLKVAFIQKGPMNLSFLQTDKPNYFPELKFWIFSHSKWLKLCQIGTWSCSECSNWALEQFQVPIWHNLNHLEWEKNQNLSSGK